MFSGEERASFTTELAEAEFHYKVQEALEPLGEVDVSDDGDISIAPKASLVSFLSTVTITGQVKSTDDGYKVSVEFSVAPSALCWVGAIVLGCFILPPFGFLLLAAPLLLDKPNVVTAAKKGLGELKDSIYVKKRKSKAAARDEEDDDD
jgi:hypothetical protein